MREPPAPLPLLVEGVGALEAEAVPAAPLLLLLLLPVGEPEAPPELEPVGRAEAGALPELQALALAVAEGVWLLLLVRVAEAEGQAEAAALLLLLPLPCTELL